ncbi:ABC transporter permease [Lysobacter enzymogenes]|uniref:ABC transporter permease n=1 Tax=Lysobacter enzymogenes TaxID=69 RepID=A0A3N2RFR6_LYSEN|nr:ABC transporter permease [Lysobacter enzymogenes]ROU06268.1 ABC transporter permease [Lysobacter enzymogenes]
MAQPLTFAAAVLASARRELGFLRASRWDALQITLLPWAILLVLMAVFSHTVLRNVPIAVVDHDRSPASRALVRMLNAAPGVYVRAMPASLEEAWPMVRRVEVYAVLYLPRDAAREVGRGQTATAIAYYNASYMTTGQAAFREISAVVQAHNAELSLGRDLFLHGRSGARAAPVRVQSKVLFNAERSYEHFLQSLLFPAVLQLAFCIAAVAAFGRELRDGSAPAWLEASGGRIGAAVAGKLLPYFVLFMLYAALALLWVGGLRSGAVAGSFAMLLTGYAGMYLAYAAIGSLLIGATRSMATALSLTGIYSGVAMAFSGGTFPTIEGPLFTQVWSRLMPFTAYVQLQVQQLDAGAPWRDSLWPLATLGAFMLVGGAFGLRLYARALRDPASWGRR